MPTVPGLCPGRAQCKNYRDFTDLKRRGLAPPPSLQGITPDVVRATIKTLKNDTSANGKRDGPSTSATHLRHPHPLCASSSTSPSGSITRLSSRSSSPSSRSTSPGYRSTRSNSSSTWPPAPQVAQANGDQDQQQQQDRQAPAAQAQAAGPAADADRQPRQEGEEDGQINDPNLNDVPEGEQQRHEGPDITPEQLAEAEVLIANRKAWFQALASELDKKAWKDLTELDRRRRPRLTSDRQTHRPAHQVSTRMGGVFTLRLHTRTPTRH
ncbi:unnamed protein product [Tilletia caries]|nr:unnamed protein product [Tilletia caries]CAD7063250.1 unnamed protein product [Tilletia caries]